MDVRQDQEPSAQPIKPSTALLQALLATAADMITISDRAGRVIYASPATEKVTGYTVAEFMAGHPFEMIHPDDRPHYEAMFTRLMATSGLSLDLQHRVLHKDGTWHWVEGTFASLFDDPTVNGLVATVRDITERKRHEHNAAFLGDLGADFARLSSPDDILRATGEKMRTHFSVSRMTFAEINEPANEATAIYDIHEPDLMSVLGTHRLSEYVSAESLCELKAGRPIVINDLRTDPRTAAHANAYSAFHVRAQILVPHVSNGRVDFIIAMQHSEPYTWRADEILLVQELATRVYLRLERARAEAALRDSEKRLRAIYDGTYEFIGLLAPDGTLLEANRSSLEFIGNTREDVVGLPFWETPWFTSTPGAPEVVRQGIQRAAAGEFVRYASPIVHSSGQVMTFDISLDPVSNEQGEVVLIVPEGRNITALRHAEDALRVSEEKYHTLFNSIDEGFCVIEILFDPNATPVDYRFVEVNPAFTEQTGVTNATGRTAREIVPHEDYWFALLGNIALTGESARFQQRAEALGRWFDVHAFPFGRPEDRQVAILFSDITERKRAEGERDHLLASEREARAAAEAALRTRDQFLSIASHELRTPLTSLIGYAYMLGTARVQDTDTTQRMTEAIGRQGQRLKRLMDQLLDVSLLQRGQFAIEHQPLDVATVVTQVVDEFRATQPADTRHALEFSRPDGPIMVAGDAERLERVIQNLLSNAVKYSPAGGVVRVRLTLSATEVLLEVEDQGIGIPVDAQAQLFEPLYRASNVGPRTSGFGLGLHIAREIVQEHGGRIGVESTEGEGSTFRVVLPRLAPIS